MSFEPTGQFDAPSNARPDVDPYFNLTTSPDRLRIKVSPADITAYLGELTDALQSFRDPLTAAQLLSLGRLWTARQVVIQQLDDEPLATFVHLGYETEVLALISTLSPHDIYRMPLLAIIAESLAKRGQLTAAMLDNILHIMRGLVDYDRADSLIDMVQRLWPIDRAQAEALLPEMIVSIYSVKDVWMRTNILIRLAPLLTKSQPERALALLNDTLTILRTEKRVWNIAHQLSAVATALMPLDRQKATTIFEEAHAAADQVSAEEVYYELSEGDLSPEEQLVKERNRVHSQITKSQRRVGLIPVDDTLRDAHEKADTYDRFSILVEALPELARTADSRFESVFDELLTLAQNVELNKQPYARQRYTFLDLRGACLKAGRFAEAWRVQELLQVNQNLLVRWQYTVYFLHRLPEAVVKSQFSELVEEAVVAVHDLPTNGDAQLLSTLRNGLFALTKLLASLGDYRAHDLMAQALTLQVPTAEAPGLYDVNHIRENWAVVLIDVGQLDVAQKLIAELPTQSRIAPLCALLEVYIAAGDPRADQILGDVLAIAHEQGQGTQIDLLLAIVQALASGKDDRATGILNEALTLARSFQYEEEGGWSWSPWLRSAAHALGQIASTMGVIDDPCADQIFDEALSLLAKIPRDPPRQETLRRFVDLLAHAGRIDQALTIAYSDIDPDKRDNSIATVLETLADAGQVDQVRAVIADYAARGYDPDLEDHIIVALANAGQYRAAQAELEGRIFSTWRRGKVNEPIATALAREGRFAEAFTQLGIQSLKSGINVMVKWTPLFERMQPGLSIDLLREITRIAAWVEPDWLTFNAPLNVP